MSNESVLDEEMAPLDFISFSGGGARGAIYSGVYSALKETRKLDPVKAVAGSSAGAITAALVATGIDPEDFEKQSKEVNFKKLTNSGRKKFINNDAEPLYKLIQDNIENNVLRFFERDITGICGIRFSEIKEEAQKVELENSTLQDEKSKLEKQKEEIISQQDSISKSAKSQQSNSLKSIEAKFAELAKAEKYITYKQDSLKAQKQLIQNISKEESPEYKALKNKVETIKLRKKEGVKKIPQDQQITFGDLSVLRALDPITYKDLVVTAVDKKKGDLKIFSPSTTPEVEIAKACKASAAIPIIFKPVEINKKQYVDGGYRDNIPMKHFVEQMPNVKLLRGKLKKKKDRTLAFAFSSDDINDPVNKAIYSVNEKIYTPSSIFKFLANVIYKRVAGIGGNFKYTDTREDTYKHLRANAMNIVPLDTKKVSTLSFDRATRKAEYLHAKGYVDTKMHIYNLDPTNKKDHELETKSFMLDFYNRIDKKGFKHIWRNMMDSKVRRHMKHSILPICHPKYKIKDPKMELEKMIETAAIKPNSQKLSVDTRSIEKLVKCLNCPSTTSDIRETFFNLLDIDYNKDKRLALKKGTSYEKLRSNFKFSKKDFKNKVAELDKLKKMGSPFKDESQIKTL